MIQRLQMAAEDLNILMSFDTAGSGGIAPVVGATVSLVGGLIKSAPALAQGDLDGFISNSSIGFLKISREASTDAVKAQALLLKEASDESLDDKINAEQNK